VIPSFGVERGQEVLLYLDDFMNSGVLPKVPIYVDGVIGKVMRIFRHNVIYCRKEIQSKILMSDYDPFKSDNFIFVESKQMRKKIVDSTESCIIVTTAGMLTGGPVVGYMKALAGNSANKLILVGFQPEGTHGRALLEGQREIDFHGQKLKVNMTVEMHKMSGHADRRQLELLPTKVQGLKEVYIVHGEPSKSQQLAEALKVHYRVFLPKIGERHTIGVPGEKTDVERAPREERVQKTPQKPQQQRQHQHPHPQKQQHSKPQGQKPQRPPQKTQPHQHHGTRGYRYRELPASDTE